MRSSTTTRRSPTAASTRSTAPAARSARSRRRASRVTDTTIRNNRAGSEGGGVFVFDTDTSIAGSTITGNQTFPKYFGGSQGGGVYSDASTISIADSKITNNSSVEGGGIYVDDTDSPATAGLVLTGSQVNRNVAVDSGAGVYLGSIDSPTQITDTSFERNTALGAGGGLYMDGSENEGTLTIADSEFVDNTSGYSGGGIGLDSPNDPVTIERTSIVDNAASAYGGGLNLNDTDEDGTVTIAASTIADNGAGFGGGLALGGDDAVTLRNSTVSGNVADEIGGGVHIDYVDVGGPDNDEGSVSLDNSTIAANTAAGEVPAGSTGAGGGVYAAATTGNVELSSTIVADNSGGDLGRDPAGPGTLTAGFSLIESPGSTPFDSAPGGSNQTGVDPALGALQDNGGPTDTQAPGGSSPALDAAVANSLTTDQRGEPRTVDQAGVPNRTGSDGTDVGAVELAALAVPSTDTCQNEPAAKQTGTAAADLLVGDDGVDLLLGAAGNDTVDGVGGPDCVQGDDGNDVARGGGGNDVVGGGAGNDKVVGAGGSDELTGSAGKDRLRGGEASDNLKGGSGSDRLKGAGGDDRLAGGSGADRLNCGAGDDVAIAGGSDTVAPNCETVK